MRTLSLRPTQATGAVEGVSAHCMSARREGSTEPYRETHHILCIKTDASAAAHYIESCLCCPGRTRRVVHAVEALDSTREPLVLLCVRVSCLARARDGAGRDRARACRSEESP